MIRNKKKYLIGLFIIIFIVTSVPLFGDFETTLTMKTDNTYAETLNYNDILSYQITNGEIIITGCDREVIALDIPDEIDGLPVTKLSADAFWRATNLEVVNIPYSVDIIEIFAFTSNLNLKEINVDEDNQNYTSIDGVLFNKKATELIHFPANKSTIIYEVPETVKTIKIKSFSQSNVKSVQLPNDLMNIEQSAFMSSTQLENITIPASVINIGVYAFVGCSSLTDINVSRESHSYTSIDGVLYTHDGTTLIQYPIGRTDTEYVIEDGTQIIGDGSFMNCSSITKITIPEGVVMLGPYSFEGTGLKSVTLPSTVEVLGSCAFWKCINLYEVNLNDNLAEMGEAVFGLCESLKRIDIPNGIKFLELGAFIDCTSLEDVKLPNTLSDIGVGAFEGCTSLESITIPDSTNVIFSLAFNNCTNLKDIYIPHYVKSIYEVAIGYQYNSSGMLELNPITTIHGYDGTAAETYAIKNNVAFESRGEIPPPSGDLNRDGIVSPDELKKMTVTIFGKKAINGATSISAKQAQYADTNKDGVLNVFDVVNMKRNILNQSQNKSN